MEEFARCCGYAVYAVAYADRSIESEEKKALHQFLNDNWIDIADTFDPFGVKSMDFVEQMVGALASDKIDAEVSFDRFKESYSSLIDKLTNEHEKFILDLCIKVASSFNRLNKSELIMLSRIERFMHTKP